MPPGKKPKKPPDETVKVNGMTNDGLILNTDNILLKIYIDTKAIIIQNLRMKLILLSKDKIQYLTNK